MNFAEYQAIQAVNFSSLKMMRESPLHYRHALTAIRAESPAMALGSAVHCAVLEPGRFALEYSPEPVFGDCRLKENKATRDLWRAANEGKKTVGLVVISGQGAAHRPARIQRVAITDELLPRAALVAA